MTTRNRFLLVSVASLLLLLLGISLGLWQLRRADFKIALRDAVQAQTGLPLVQQSEFESHIANAQRLHRRARLIGVWDAEHTVYWDNFPMDGRAGLVVLTPLKLEQGVVLVQRGWIPRNAQDRSQLHPIETPSGPVVVEGELVAFPSQRIALGGGDVGLVRQNPQVSDYRALYGAQFATLTLRQTGIPSQGMLRNWAQPDDGVAMHLGYAFQWFALSALIAVYYFWFQIVKRKR